MKRRHIMIGGAAALVAPSIGKSSMRAYAAEAPDPNRLNKDLTPLGGERAASASGLVPAWTGGITTPPAGWTKGMVQPDLFAGQKPIFSVTAANFSQYANMLCDGQKLMFQRYPTFRMDVYPCERTASAPQYVYDNTFKNVTRARAVDAGLTIGITDVFGGAPFPILSADPTIAGAQAVWNHVTRWIAYCFKVTLAQYVVGGGSTTITASETYYNRSQYYNPNLTVDTFSGFFTEAYIEYTAPPNNVGGKFYAGYTLQPFSHQNVSYEYLVGEGRIREAPAAQYDVPSVQFGDAINFDEVNGFEGALDRYVWTLTGKKEMIVPYNCQRTFTSPQALLGEQFLNPDLVRWEVHRCWVVDGILAPGARMSDPHRRFFLDEDTWTIVMSELWDDQGNYWRWHQNHPICHPDLPGTIGTGTENHYNFQEGSYVNAFPYFDTPVSEGGSDPYSFDPLPANLFNPQSMANTGNL